MDTRTDDLNAWLSWALYAVAGQLREADALMRVPELAGAVRRTASLFAREWTPERRPTYRGLLLAPERVPEDRVLSPRESDAHSSWTEDRGVATWFADRDGVLAELVRAQDGEGVRGWLATRAAPEPYEVLLHWTWLDRLPVPIGELALMHPQVAPFADQVAWNAATQREVVLLPTSYAVDPHENEPEATRALDARLTHPGFRHLCRA